MHVQPGDSIGGRFRLEQLVGWGGQALVFRATNLRPKRDEPDVLALKVARTDLLSTQAIAEAAEVLGWEATLLHRLKHPALPRIMRSSNDGGLVWLARDLIEGRSLLGRAPQPEDVVRGWAVQVLELLRFLHLQEPPVICGDIKPANLIEQSNGRLVLVDIGAAHTRTRRPARTQRPRHGTPGYAAPEQMGDWALDERSDLFALAVMCYEMLTGIDPTTAPLQFDLIRLDAVAPTLAPTIRWGLALDLQRRAPTAATMLAELTGRRDTIPLVVRPGVRIQEAADILPAALEHPQALELALSNGYLERWLVDHPDAQLGTLAHRLRNAQQNQKAGTRYLDALLRAMAPEDGSPLLRAVPDQLNLGRIPPPRWRVWSPATRLTLINDAQLPVPWELNCPGQRNADVRILSNGRPVRSWSGMVPPGGRVPLDIVAVGKAGPLHGILTMRCGNYSTNIAWQAEGVQGIPIGGRMVTQLQELDIKLPDLLAQLEELAEVGALQRWLNSIGEQYLAQEIAPITQTGNAQARMLLAARIPHRIAPVAYPLIAISIPQGQIQAVTGKITKAQVVAHNIGTQPCVVAWQSDIEWVHPGRAIIVNPGQSQPFDLSIIAPIGSTAGVYQARLTMHSGNLNLPTILPISVASEAMWRRVLRWLRN